MTDIEDDAPPLVFSERIFDLARVVEDALRVPVEGMRDHVSGAEHLDERLQRRVGFADMDHHEPANGLRRLDSAFQRFHVVLAGDILGESGLDADNAVAILSTDANGLAYVGMSQVFELADVVGNHACQGDIQQGEQPGVRPFDDISSERGESGRARRSCVDGSRHTVRYIGDVRVDSVVRNTPEVVDVEVDQTRSDDQSLRVEDLSSLVFGYARCNGCDHTVEESNVGRAVDSLRRIDDGSVLDKKVVQRLCHMLSPYPARKS